MLSSSLAPRKSTMDRGTDALKVHLTACSQLDVRQTRRGYCMECCCPCQARSEFHYMIPVDPTTTSPDDRHIASSLEDSNPACRYCCSACHPFTMVVKEVNTNAELLTVQRPCRCMAMQFKCCCYQTARISSGGQRLGVVKEQCTYCVPSFRVTNDKGEALYIIHPPTCVNGYCYNPFTEGNPLGSGCCKLPFRIYPADAADTNGDAPYIGKILKRPKSAATEILTDANSFLIDFPAGANVEHKAILVGTSIFLNAVFFEGAGEDGGFLSMF
jgi:hypothetical protein